MISKEDIAPVNMSEIVALRALVRELLSRQPAPVLNQWLAHAKEDIQVFEDRKDDIPEAQHGLARDALKCQLDILERASAERRD